MKVTSEELEHRHVALTIEVEEDRVQRALQETARRISRQRPVPGFRPGRAPLAVILRRLGREAVYDALVDDIGDAVYQEALEELDLKPVGQAHLEDVQLEPLVLKLTVPLEPVIELGDFRELRLEPPTVSVGEDEVTEALEELKERNARWELVTRPTQLGDMVTASLRGTRGDGEEVFNDEKASLRLSLDSPLPTLHEQLLDMSVDEERDFDITYPQNYSDAELAGQTMHFWGRLLETRERVLPEIDDEWAKTVGDYDSLDDLRLTLRERLEQQAEQRAAMEYASEVVAALVEQAQIDYPEELVEQTLDRMLLQQDMALRRQGLDLELYMRMEGKTREQLRDELREQAEDRLRRSLALQKVAELEDLAVTPLEVTSYIRLVSSTYGSQAEDMRRTMLASESFQESVRQDLLIDKATDRLVSVAKGEAEVAEAAAAATEPLPEEAAPESSSIEESEEAIEVDESVPGAEADAGGQD